MVTQQSALTRRNSLTKSPKSTAKNISYRHHQHEHQHPKQNLKSPAQSKKCDHIELKPLNNLKDNSILTETALSNQIKLEESVVTPTMTSPRLSIIDRLEMFVEPHLTCFRGRDDYSLYLFAPDNR